jgi:hypothetical protein
MSIKIRVREQNVSYVWHWCNEHLKIGTWRLWYGFVSTSFATFEFDNEYALTLFKLECAEYIE